MVKILFYKKKYRHGTVGSKNFKWDLNVLHSTVRVYVAVTYRDSATRSFNPIFHDSNHSGPLIHMLKYLHVLSQFRGDIRMCKKLHSVNNTTESDSASLMTSRSQILYVVPKNKISGITFLKCILLTFLESL